MPQCQCIAVSSGIRCRRFTKKTDKYCSSHSACRRPAITEAKTQTTQKSEDFKTLAKKWASVLKRIDDQDYLILPSKEDQRDLKYGPYLRFLKISDDDDDSDAEDEEDMKDIKKRSHWSFKTCRPFVCITFPRGSVER